MSHVVEAIYENGVLKLKHPLPLPEQQNVRVTVELVTPGEHSFMDIESVHLGNVLQPLTRNDDLLDEMLQGR